MVEPIREELLELGFLSLSVVEANGSVPEATVTAKYRGVAIERHLRPKTRLECVVGADLASTAFDTVVDNGGQRSFVFVVSVEQAYPTETVKVDEAAVQAG